MEAPVNPQRGHGFWTWVIAAGGMAMPILGLFISQAYAAGITVTSATINDGTTLYPTVFEANWVASSQKAWTLTPNLSGTTVITVSVSGTKPNPARALRVELLDGAATVISTGCVATPSGTTFSVTVDVVPDVTFSSVARVKALGLTAC